VAKAVKKAGKGAKKAATKSLTLSVPRVRLLGLQHDSITAAAAHLGKRWDLAKLLESHADLHAAWRRGQLLRNLRRLAGVGATRHEAAHDLEMALEDFEALVSKDLEAAEIWNSGKLETAVKVKESLLANAMEGKAQAIKQLENVLRSEIAHAQFNVHRVAEPLVCEIFGVTRQSLNIWHREKGCPRNAGETTYDLPAMLAWFEKFIRAKVSGQAAPDVNPLQAVKAERLELELRTRKGELVEVESVKAGLLARERALLAILEHRPEELAQMLAGKTKQEIKPVLEKFFEDLRREWVAAAERETTGQ
jgi:hypothetical protein